MEEKNDEYVMKMMDWIYERLTKSLVMASVNDAFE
jgi:hypothetical protein